MGRPAQVERPFGSHDLGSDPEAVLGETPGNVAIPPAEIRPLTVDRRSRSAGAGDDAMDVPCLRVTLETGSGKRTFDTDNEPPPFDEARALVAGLLGQR